MLRTAWAVGVLVVVCPGTLRAGLYYEQEVWIPPSQGRPAQTIKVVGYISGRKVRAETRSEPGRRITITRLDDGVVCLLVPEKKVYVAMPIPGREQKDVSALHLRVTKTEQTRVIRSFRCTRYDVETDRYRLRCWMTTDVDVGPETATYWQAGSRLYPVALTRELAKLPGFPVRIELQAPRAALTITVTAVRKQEVPEDLFEVPADYERAVTVFAPPEPSAAPAGNVKGGGSP